MITLLNYLLAMLCAMVPFTTTAVARSDQTYTWHLDGRSLYYGEPQSDNFQVLFKCLGRGKVEAVMPFVMGRLKNIGNNNSQVLVHVGVYRDVHALVLSGKHFQPTDGEPPSFVVLMPANAQFLNFMLDPDATDVYAEGEADERLRLPITRKTQIMIRTFQRACK